MGINRRPLVAHCRATTHLQTETHTHTHTFQISNMFRKTLAILALVALFSVACAAPQRALLQDETATAAPAPTTAPATDEIDTAANTTTTTTEEASASQAAAPEGATMPQTGFEWMQAYNPYAQFLGGWCPGAGIEAYEAAMNATAAQFAGAGAGAFMPLRIPQMPQWNPQWYTPSFGGWYPGQGFESVVSALTG